MEKGWVIIPPTGPVEETIVDRRTGRSWITTVEPFALSSTVVTRHQWEEALPTPRPEQDLPQVGVSWRDAITFCNKLSRREGLTEAYTVTTRTIESPTPCVSG